MRKIWLVGALAAWALAACDRTDVVDDAERCLMAREAEAQLELITMTFTQTGTDVTLSIKGRDDVSQGLDAATADRCWRSRGVANVLNRARV